MTPEPIVVQPFQSSSSDNRMQSLTSSSMSTSCSFSFHQAPTKGTAQTHGTICVAAEDVTTIFVVGFPDDMTEREFQNMFTFSTGFEAASLKWHCKDQEDENGLPGNASTPASVPNISGKKQMIGFARFHTRPEALKAAEVMNGKRVDQDRSIFIKAEMAKKNLHIKRGACAASGTPTQGNWSSNFDNNKLQTSPSPQQFQRSKGYHPRESFSPLPSDLLSPIDYYKADPFTRDLYSCSAPTAPIFSDSLFGLPNGSQENNILGLLPSPTGRGFGLKPQARTIKGATRDTMAASSNEDPSCHHYCHFVKSSPVPNDRGFGPSSPPTDLPRCLSHNNSNCTSRSSSSSSPSAIHHHHHVEDLRSHLLSSSSLNPADHNPPCNTLYVGNLPPTTNEDELRQLFCKCRAFKRMSFRNKAQGPMCFVEFEDVASAKLAMNDLQGHMLSTSIKGGIRLSFSKNPLFTKSGKDQQQMVEATLLFAFEGVH